jgi:hypothetical protein
LEIDELMWQVADSGDPKARLEFANRYPQWVPELDNRAAMARRFRSAKPAASVVPFQSGPLLNQVPKGLSWRGVSLSVAGLALAAIVIGQVVASLASSNQVRTEDSAPVTRRAGFGSETGLGDALGEASPVDRPINIDALDPRRSVVNVASGSSLRSTLINLAKDSKIQLVFAPGFQDQQVKIEVHYADYRHALNRLGQEFGFTALEQQEGTFLLVPEVDHSQEPQPIERSETRNKWPPTED